nr:histone-lysine N-methyltransferase SETMAR-like [Leptinotarsa decemlineata]
MLPGQTITAETYCEEFDEIYQKLRLHGPALVNSRDPILLHDNVRPHVSQITVEKLNELSVEGLPHTPYCPDLSPLDHHLVKHFDNFLTDRTIANKYQAKRLSSTSSNTEHAIFMLKELIDLCYVGKSVLNRMAPILIELNKYSLRYYSLR